MASKKLRVFKEAKMGDLPLMYFALKKVEVTSVRRSL